MITLSAYIDVTLGKAGTITNATTTIGGNNVSENITGLVGEKVYGNNIFLLDVSHLDNGSTFSSETENYYIGSELSNESGLFANPYQITLYGSKIKTFTLVFDTYNNQHPTAITVDNKEYENDDNIFTVSVESADTHTIVIDNWNTPNCPLRIQGIYLELGIEVNKQNIESLSRNSTDRSDYKFPIWGIISNTCEIEFKDLNGEILDYIEQDLLVQGLSCQVYINDTLRGVSRQIGEYYADQWNYDNDNRIVKVSLKDDLEEWQNINVEGISYDPRDLTHRNLEWFYGELYKKTPQKYKMKQFNELDDKTKNILSNTWVAYPLLEAGSLWRQWNKLCQVAQAHIQKEDDGTTSFKYNGGN